MARKLRLEYPGPDSIAAFALHVGVPSSWIFQLLIVPSEPLATLPVRPDLQGGRWRERSLCALPVNSGKHCYGVRNLHLQAPDFRIPPSCF